MVRRGESGRLGGDWGSVVLRVTAAVLYVGAMVLLVQVLAVDRTLERVPLELGLLSVAAGFVINRPWALLLPATTFLGLLGIELVGVALAGGSVREAVGEGAFTVYVIIFMAPAALGALIGLVARMAVEGVWRRLRSGGWVRSR